MKELKRERSSLIRATEGREGEDEGEGREEGRGTEEVGDMARLPRNGTRRARSRPRAARRRRRSDDMTR